MPAAYAETWHPAPGPLFTRWTELVSPANTLPEYPRPQLVRADWLNLNGLWQYAVTPLKAPAPTNFAGQILVPFPFESALSGVMRRLDGNRSLWYQRTFRVPPDWAGRRVRLHFGAADWRTRVIVNGHEAGQHRGGYDSFSFDITDDLTWTNNEVIQVAVWDPTEGNQPRGKQVRQPEGIFYTPTSGLWQTVWLEPVPEISIDGLRLTPDVDTPALRARVAVGSLNPSLQVELRALTNGQEVARVVGPPNEELTLPLPDARLWSPEDPFLYDLQVTLLVDGRVVDSVGSYFGMRKIALRKDGAGVTRIALNNQFLLQIGVLDQGFWPDGLYTAPTDEALRFDLEFLKRAGFNLVRKHVKVEPERWYYWCDKLGLLVWQDMPSGNNATPESRAQFEVELQRMVDGRFNHPSLIVWVLFNEGWGQYDTERLTAWLKALDPSRLASNASGWTDKRVGDLIDLHSYPGPDYRRPEPDRAAVLGEFGGLGLDLPGHTWASPVWAYSLMPDAANLTQRYRKLLDRVHFLNNAFGLSAAVYTQLADVETEGNGLMTYDRAVVKIAPEEVLAANQGTKQELPWHILVSNALYEPAVWRCTTNAPGANWYAPEFNDAGWDRGEGGFGTEETPNSVVGTLWNTEDIWLRREFTLGHDDLSAAQIQWFHDEDAELYLNGVLAAQAAGYVTDYGLTNIAPAAAATLKPGRNLMAVHCHQTTGGQFIDAGLVSPKAGAK